MDVQSAQKPILSKTSIVLFTAIQIISGLDYGYVKFLSKKWGIVLKIIAFAFSLSVTVYFTKPAFDNTDEGISYYLLYSVEYLTYTLILFFSKYTLYEFLYEFEELGSRTVNRKILREVVIRAAISPFLCVFFMLITLLSYCLYSYKPEYCSYPPAEYFFRAVTNFAFNNLLLVQYVIMYTYYRHMSHLKSNVVDHELKSNEVLRVYKSILDAMDKIKPVFDKLIMTCIIIAVPRFMATEYMVLKELNKEFDWVLLALPYTVVLQMGFLMTLPSLTAESVNSQADEILLTLHNDLVETTDEQKRFEIKSTIRYMNARPSQYYVWRRIPVDIRLPMAIISLMTTYLIVIIQFTHLFD